ncbi:MAG: hypothetical protein HYX88_03585, partial [Chloroflexi bacterium]|nr:hypothetical protein [Chloroflexota bacterium]
MKEKIWKPYCCWLCMLPLIILIADRLSSSAMAETIVVDGKSNIFGAGHTTPPGGGLLPPQFAFTPGEGQFVEFTSVTGTVTYDISFRPFQGPDGGPHIAPTNVSSAGGISGIRHDEVTGFLVGVFLDDTEPTETALPVLNFTGATNFTDLFPILNQTFFIGDGLTGTGSGLTQRFHVPAGATRLFLGLADAWNGSSVTGPPGLYDDNGGSFTVTFDLVASSLPGIIQFGTPAIQVAENSGDVTITVFRRGGRKGTVTVDFETSDGTATAGSDYIPVSGTLTFADGETRKAFSVPIIADTVFEGIENVNLSLHNPTGGATLGSQSTAVLNINDTEFVSHNFIQESATLGSIGQTSGFSIMTSQFLGWRFRIDGIVEITRIGGHLSRLQGGNRRIFAAIVKLDGPTAFPLGTPFGPTMVAVTTFDPGSPSSDVRASLSVRLGPGDYALVFGSGLFGATGEAVMPSNNGDIPGRASYLSWVGSLVSWSGCCFGGTRFVVEGNILSSEGTADLQLGATTSAAPETERNSTSLTLAVSNAGPTRATGVTLSESFPGDVIVDSIVPSQGSCAGANFLTCALGDINVGATATVEIVVTLDTSGAFTHIAKASANEPDLLPSNSLPDTFSDGGPWVPLRTSAPLRKKGGMPSYP